jgi:hypothetical protein
VIDAFGDLFAAGAELLGAPAEGIDAWSDPIGPLGDLLAAGAELLRACSEGIGA